MPIKLIAADMDGTLLDSAKQLPEGLFPLIRTLRARGVRFAPASGRQYYTLYEQFRDSFGAVADELIYISENGAMVCDGAKLLSFDAMPADEVCRAVEAVRRMPGVYTIVSAQDGGVYEQGDDAAFQENIALYCTRRRPVPDLLEFVRHEPVCKVALFCAGPCGAGAAARVCGFFRDVAGRAVGRGLGGPDAPGHEQGRGAGRAVHAAGDLAG